MGAIKTIELANGNIGLEITYGGREALFGGVDTSAPPAYIDPKCFAACESVLVVDNKIVPVSWASFTVPTLWSSTPGVQLLGFGTFYNSIYGQLNYALGYTSIRFGNPGTTPTGTKFKFYITSWTPVAIPTVYNDTLPITLYDGVIPATAASRELDCISSSYAGTGTVQLVVTGPSGPQTFSYAVTGADTRATVVAGLVQIGTDVTIIASEDGFGIVITENATGVIGNATTVVDLSSGTGTLPPPFYFSPVGNPINLEGGAAISAVVAPSTLQPCSTAQVGGTLYIGNVGPMILKYSGPRTFTASTMYNGVGVLRKFAGSLIGLRNIPQLGMVLQDADMIFSWSAANALDEWAPVNSAGLVTGAGFEQLADIDDPLIGLIVTQGTAYILRSQGVSYATATGNASLPFQVNHIGLGDEGEGAQNSQLVAQYDQIGAWIGNSDIFQIVGQMTPIGAKIKAALFNQLAQNPNLFLSAVICSLFLGMEQNTFLAFMIGSFVYIYNISNGTWTIGSWVFDNVHYTLSQAIMGTLVQETLYENGETRLEAAMLIGSQTTKISNSTLQAPTFLALTDAVSLSSGQESVLTSLTFPVEEVAFGRDITIDSLYIAVIGQLLSADVVVGFYINGQAFAAVTLPAAKLNASLTPVEFQVFPTTLGAGAFTAKSPQLSWEIANLGTNATAQLRFTKMMMLGSYDPKQRPA